MGWASKYIIDLKENKTVKFRPRGNSMKGKIESGQLVTVDPLTENSVLEKEDIVLCKVGATAYLHKIIAIDGKRIQIGNNKGRINGWTSRSQIFGKCIKVED